MNLENTLATRVNKTIYRDGNKCIKKFNKDFSKADVLNEALNIARVEETNLNVPSLLEVTMIDDCWVIVTEFIEGKTLTQIIEENPDNVPEQIDLLIDLQLQVHAQKCPLLTKLRDKMFRKISQTEYDPVTKYELQTYLDGMPRHNKVCHGDFRPSNILITPEGKPYIIDWSHVTQGNASADAARSYLLFLLGQHKDYSEYYINQYCKKTDVPRSYVDRWVRIVAASQAVGNTNKDELEFLSRMVHVIDFT